MSAPSGPIQRLVRSLLVLVCVCVLGLIAGVVLVSIQNAETSRRLTALEDYVQGKGEQRDRENDQLRELIRKTQCDLLDTFPQGGLLDRAREKYGCGPGLPLEDLTPEEQQLARPRSATPGAAARPSSGYPSSPAPLTPGAGRSPSRAAQPPSPVRPPTGPTPEPLVNVGPLVDPLCDAVGVCL